MLLGTGILWTQARYISRILCIFYLSADVNTSELDI
jgi:hypothetical protein